MLVLVTLEPFVKSGDAYSVLSSLGCAYVVEWGRRRIILDVEGCGEGWLPRLRSIEAVSHIIIIEDRVPRDLTELGRRARLLLSRLLESHGEGTFRVLVKRIDKSFPMTSIDLGKALGVELSSLAHPNLEDPDYYIYVEVREDHVLLGYALRGWFSKSREAIPRDLVNRVVIVVEGLRTKYEVMDIIQLGRSWGLEVRLITDPELVRSAYHALGIGEVSNVRVVSTEEALEGIDVPVVLSMHASKNERALIELVSGCLGRLGLIAGGEDSDVSLALRSRAKLEVRLGPLTGNPMRTSNALSYALGIIMGAWIGYSV